MAWSRQNREKHSSRLLLNSRGLQDQTEDMCRFHSALVISCCPIMPFGLLTGRVNAKKVPTLRGLDVAGTLITSRLARVDRWVTWWNDVIGLFSCPS